MVDTTSRFPRVGSISAHLVVVEPDASGFLFELELGSRNVASSGVHDPFNPSRRPPTDKAGTRGTGGASDRGTKNVGRTRDRTLSRLEAVGPANRRSFSVPVLVPTAGARFLRIGRGPGVAGGVGNLPLRPGSPSESELGVDARVRRAAKSAVPIGSTPISGFSDPAGTSPSGDKVLAPMAPKLAQSVRPNETAS